jgi:hypothetical protein
VRDLALRQALRGLAADAGERLRGLIEAGEELPYDVTEPREGSPFAQFAPQTAPFIRGHGTILLELDSFAPACSAIAASDAAKPYLEWLGEPIPNDPGRRAADAVLAFLCRLWEASADFSLDERRLEGALAELETSRQPPKADDEAEVVVPVLGLQMPISRLELSGATLVRAEAVDAPGEVRAGDGARRAAWEPLFLAAVRRRLPAPGRDGRIPPDEGPGPALRHLVTALRLFKPGGVSLGPYAWARSFSGDRWRRISTGAARARGDGYWLVESELSDLAAFSRVLAEPTTPIGPAERLRGPAATIARAVARFEAGLERHSLLDALSDYLLALRFVLEGEGPAGVGVPMRAAALRAEPDGRPAIKATVDRAVALEEALVRGESGPPQGQGEGSPLELVVRMESVVRRILRDAVSGALGTDPRAAADEILLADGLAAGDGSAAVRGATEEWDAAPSESQEAEDVGEEPNPAPQEAQDLREAPQQPAPEPKSRRRDPPMLQQVELSESAAEEFEPQVAERGPDESDLADTDSKNSSDAGRSLAPEREEEGEMADRLHREAARDADGTWLDELDSSATLDWPERPAALRLLDQRPAERKATRNRVEHLFPRPETTEWSVGELDYDRRRRRARV